LHALPLEAGEQRFDRFQKDGILRVMVRVRPGKDVKPCVARKILAVDRTVLEVRSMAIESARLVVGNLMCPKAEREALALLRR
jgi:hypothetical protein